MPLTVEEVYEGVRSELGDTHSPGGEFAFNELLSPFYKSAYSEAITALRKRGIMRLRKEVYYLLPARTGVLTPAQLGVEDLLGPEFVWERGHLTKASVQSASAGAPAIVTAAGHPFGDGSEVFLCQVGAQVNGRWFISVLDPNTFSLNGSAATATYAPPNGLAIQSDDLFTLLTAPNYLGGRDPAEKLVDYVFADGLFHFIGATTERQLKISYFSNGAPPATGAIGIEDLRNFLIARTAQKAAGPGDQRQRAKDLSAEANYHLGEFVRTYVRDLQRMTFQPPPFRRRRARLFY